MNNKNNSNLEMVISENPVYYWDYTDGDSNDVYERKTLKGTYDQVEKYIKSQFSEEGLNKSEDMSGLGDITLTVWLDVSEDEINEGNEDELLDTELIVDFSISAAIIHEVNEKGGYITDSDIDIDLTKEDDQ